MAKSYIIAVCEYSPQILEHKMLHEVSNEHIEINIFDLPRLDSKDTVERINERTFVHRYANLSNKLCDSFKRDKEYIRDIIALGASMHYVFKPKNRDLIELCEHIVRALEVYGVDYEYV
ncbi:MAG: hypothetical protein IKR37_04810 [Paludibacteraceae bacterium]|nr:hypothetical protein [Paludibacteraceae bacterium]